MFTYLNEEQFEKVCRQMSTEALEEAQLTEELSDQEYEIIANILIERYSEQETDQGDPTPDEPYDAIAQG